jgi:hypothetical protein
MTRPVTTGDARRWGEKFAADKMWADDTATDQLDRTNRTAPCAPPRTASSECSPTRGNDMPQFVKTRAKGMDVFTLT